MSLYHLIRNRDNAYWRPEGQGYTDKVSEAGRFMEQYAWEVVESTYGEVRMEEINVTSTLSSYEQALIHLASFDLRYSVLRRDVESLLKSRRPIGQSGIQEAVLSEALDKLAESVKQEPLKWGEIKES